MSPWGTDVAELSRETLEQAIRKKVARPLYATLTGDHVRGLASDRSAYSVVGSMLTPVRELLGLRPARETKERTLSVESREVRIHFHDLRRTLDDLARLANTRSLEELYSPLVVFGGPEFEKLRRVARGFLTRNCYHDFLERAGQHRQRLVDDPAPKANDLVEAARIFLTGTHLLRTGEMDVSVPSLIERYEAYWLRPFVSRRQIQGEDALLSADEARILRYDLESLEMKLHAAHDNTALPEGGGSITTLDEFLIELRLRELRASESPS